MHKIVNSNGSINALEWHLGDFTYRLTFYCESVGDRAIDAIDEVERSDGVRKKIHRSDLNKYSQAGAVITKFVSIK